MVPSCDITFSSPCQITFRFWGLGLQHLLGGYKSTSNSSTEIFILLYANTSVTNINKIRFTKENMNRENEVKVKVIQFSSVQFSSVAQSCPTLRDPMYHSTPGLPVHHQLPEFTQTHVHWVGDASSHLILCCPLLPLPSIFPSTRVFSNESALRIRWPKYWSFSFSISASNEESGLIIFRMD